MVASLLCWRDAKPYLVLAAVVGAWFPDVPMFFFYAVEKFWFGTPEMIVWQEKYFLAEWQNFIDLFNSIPIFLVILGFSFFLKNKLLRIFCLSALLHIACDLPVHHDDGHRHFFPLFDWKFESPVSYWDPNHFGLIFAPLELFCSLAAAIYLVTSRRGLVRWFGGFVVLTGIAGASFALIYWVS